MDKQEYLKAIKTAKTIFAYVAITKDGGKVPIEIGKSKAAQLVRLLPEPAEIDAVWASDHQEILLVGGPV